MSKVTDFEVWAVRVMDLDPDLEGRSREVVVKLSAPVQPVPPVGAFQPVEFEGVTVTPWVNDKGRMQYSIRATGIVAPKPARTGRVLTKGAAVGFLVRGYVQDPRKDTVPMRGLFTHRIALGLDTPSEVDMVLGEGAHARGAHADRIPLHAKGMAYELEDGNPEPYRVRAGFPTDDDIRAVAEAFPAPRPAPTVPDGEATVVTVPEPRTTNGNGRRKSGDTSLIPASLLAALTRDDNTTGGEK